MTVRLPVRVHPGARRDALEGRLADGTLKVAVSAPPEDGRANRAVETLRAAALKVKRSQVTVVRGAGSRAKLVEIDGLDQAEAGRRIDAVLGRGTDNRDE
jgi:uncharacterized protein YggU (UPF0235/DUF167 family)